MLLSEVTVGSNFLVRQPASPVMGNEEKLKLARPVTEVVKCANVFRQYSESWNKLDLVMSVMELVTVS